MKRRSKRIERAAQAMFYGRIDGPRRPWAAVEHQTKAYWREKAEDALVAAGVIRGGQ